MRESLPVVFGVYREVAGAVFASQVVGPVAWLSGQDCDIRLLCLAPVGTWFRRRAHRHLGRLKGSVRDRLGDRTSWLPAAPSRMQSDPVAAWQLSMWLHRHYGNEPVILHCRGSRMTEMGLRVRRHRSDLMVVYDCRGIDHAEYRYEHSDSGTAAIEIDWECQRRFERQELCLHEADSVLCVSESMANYFNVEWGKDIDPSCVIPCVVDVPRFERGWCERDWVRKELGIEDRLVVTYNGSMHSWQMPAQCLRVFGMIKELHKEAHFLALTISPDAMYGLARQHGLYDEDITIMEVPHEDVPRYLAAGDIGLLLRERSLVNEVASPVKFGEYLAAGLSVIMTDGVGDYSELTKTKGVGVVIDLDVSRNNLLDNLATFLNELSSSRPSCRYESLAIARQMLSAEWGYGKLQTLYQQLSKDHCRANGAHNTRTRLEK